MLGDARKHRGIQIIILFWLRRIKNGAEGYALQPLDVRQLVVYFPDLFAGLQSPHYWHVEVENDCIIVPRRDFGQSILVLVDLYHDLLHRLDSLIAVHSFVDLHFFYFLLKSHLKRVKLKNLVVGDQDLRCIHLIFYLFRIHIVKVLVCLDLDGAVVFNLLEFRFWYLLYGFLFLLDLLLLDVFVLLFLFDKTTHKVYVKLL